MAKAKKTLSLVMIAIFTTFIVLSGIPTSAVTKKTTKKAAPKKVVVKKPVVKKATPKPTPKPKVTPKPSTKPIVLTEAQKQAAAAKLQAAKDLAAAQDAVNKAEELTNTDTYDLEGSDTDLQNAQDAVTNALEAVVKLDNESANYKGLMARIDAANANIVKAMEARDAAAAQVQADKDEAAAVAAADTAVKAVEDAAKALKTADDLTKALDLGKTALDAVDKVTEADKKADFTTRLTAAGKIATDFKAQLDDAAIPATIKVSAVDGTITVTFSKKPATAPVLADFTVKNGTAVVTPTAIKVVDDTTTTLTVPAITATDKDQSVVYSVAYSSAAAVDAAAFTVAKLTYPGVVKVENTATDTLKVTLNAAVDTTKATLSVTKSTVVTAVKTTTWSDDKTVATLVFYSSLSAGDYVVTLGGVTPDPDKKSGTVTVKGSTVTTIEIPGTVAILTGATGTAKSATFAYDVKDQFGTDITSTATGLAVSSSSGGTSTIDTTNKKITINWATAPAVDDAVVVSIVDSATGVVGSKALKVGAASTGSKISFSELKNVDSKVLRLSSDVTADRFAFDVTATDQYGNAIITNVGDSFTVITPAAVNLKVAFENGNTSTSTPAKLRVTAIPTTSGTYTVTVLPNGNLTAPVTVNVVVNDSIALATLTMAQPTDLIAAGEKIKIPFTAFDQYGTAMTATSDIKTHVTLSTSDSTHVTATVENNPVDNTAYIQLAADATCPAETVIVTSVAGTKNTVSTLSIPVKAAAVPTRISGTVDVAPKMAVNAVQDISSLGDYFVIKDQYERDVDMTDFPTYSVKLTSSDEALVSVTPAAMNLTGIASGTATITADLLDATGTKVANGSYTFDVSTVKKADITSYAIDEIGTVFSAVAANTQSTTESALYAKDFTVYGLTASGAKVALADADIIKISSTNSLVEAIATTSPAVYVKTALSDPGTNETGTIVAVVSGNSGIVTVTKSFTISDAAPVGGTITVGCDDTVSLTGNAAVLTQAQFDGKYVTKSAKYTTTGAQNAAAYFVVADQYGVASAKVAPTYYTLSIADKAGVAKGDTGYAGGNYSINATTGQVTVALSSYVKGDVLTITGITKDGKVATLKIITN